MAVIDLVRLDICRGPFGMMRRVGVFLALETNADVLRILQTVLADDVGIAPNTLEVTAVDLDTRLIGINLEQDACLSAVEAGCHL